MMGEYTAKDVKLLMGLAVRMACTLVAYKIAMLFVIPVLPLREKIKAEERLLRLFANCKERYKAIKKELS